MFPKIHMPTFGAHFPDEIAETIETAAKASPEKKVGPYITEAVMQRLSREGMLPGNPQAELIAAAEEVGIENAISALQNMKRPARRKHAA
jgi:hypothetical protein